MSHTNSASPNIVAIIQARLGSSRLPLKSLLSLRDYPIIDWICQRLCRSKLLSQMIVAIPDTQLDEILGEHLQRRGIPFMAGSESDVLSRFTQAAEITKADLVVRICADNPLVWWEAIDRLIEFYLSHALDYAYNHVPKLNLWPDGLGAEIISRTTLWELHEKAKLKSQREHCLNYIWDNAAKFRIGTFDPVETWLRRPYLKLDIDTREDFRKLSLKNINPDMNAQEILNTFLNH